MPNADVAAPEPDLPEGALVTGQVLLTTYVTSEGSADWAIGTSDGMQASSTIGMLNSAAHMLMHELLTEPDE